MSFSYVGQGPYSKSLINRAYLVQSYFPEFKITGDSSCEDVQIIKKAIDQFQSHQKDIFCKDSATAFRFMAMRVSRRAGEYVLSGTPSLLQRPHKDLISILHQLGVQAEFQSDKTLKIKSSGWKIQGDAVTFSSHVSSQFASALLMNSFNLKEDLFISLEGPSLSLAYLQMTLFFLEKIGIKVKGKFPEFIVPAGQKLLKNSYEIEPDMSCLFSIACFASIKGQATFTPWIQKSIQPDSIFPQLLSKMGVFIEEKESSLTIKSHAHRNGLSADLSQNPDLFPSLSILCALSDGESFLYNVPHLKFKESDRLKLTIELLEKAGRKVEIHSNGLKINGSSKDGKGVVIHFDPQNDHRMAMAAALLSYFNFQVNIKHPECVNKSFPEFWDIINL